MQISAVAKIWYDAAFNGSNAMKHVRLSDARDRIAELLDEVERGETVMISREGELAEAALPVIGDKRREEAQQAMRELRELRKGAGKVTVEEILAWRDEGRRF